MRCQEHPLYDPARDPGLSCQCCRELHERRMKAERLLRVFGMVQFNS